MMDVTRLFVSTALLFCTLSDAGSAWGQQPQVPNYLYGGQPPASTVPAHLPYGAYPGSFVSAPTAAYYPNAAGTYVPYVMVPNGPYGMLPQNDAYVVPAANVVGGHQAQKEFGPPAQPGPVEAIPGVEPETPEFAFDFQEQSATFATATYAAAPSMIGDMFGGGSSTSIIGSAMTFSLTAEGEYFAGTPGDTAATIGFDVSVPNGSVDFLSVGPALTPDGRRFAISEPLPPTDAPTTTAAGFAFSGGTATNSTIVNPTIGNLQLWDVSYSYSKTTAFVMPNPGGSVVGRMKIAENASPMPRDRVFFNYSLFDNVPLQASGVTVNRFTPGFEKASPGNQDASIEVRFPFAATLSSNIVSDGATETENMEFGNIFVTFKKVLEKSDNWLVSGGVSVTIPTANGLSVAMVDGTPLVSVDNQSVHVMPFLAGLTTVGERMFAQGFMQFDFDTSGNPVQLNLTGSGLSTVGKVQDTNFVYVDIGMGYWVRRPGDRPDAFVTSIVPTFELHINRSLQATDVLAAGPFRIGEPLDTIQLNSFVVGSTFGMAGGNSFTVGYAIPFGNGTDQAFDGELRAFWNRTF